jgi:hypothetical protein
MRLVLSAPRVSTLFFCMLACALLASACAGSGAGPTGGQGASGGNTDMAEAGAADTDLPDSLAFTPSTTVMLDPKETRELTVTASPAGIFRVRFALLGSSADSAPGDAVLDQSEVPTGEDGVAHVTLTAPSTPATFSVRASVASKVQALLGVSVGSRNSTDLLVQPAYNGHRDVTEWTASFHLGSSCSKLVGNPPPDGINPITVSKSELLSLPKVPIGVSVTVALRAGHYIGGCADLSPLSEGDGNQVLVYASDVPINLAATQLALSFGPTDVHPEFSKLMKSSASTAESALTGNALSDVQALLDAMASATPAVNRDAFSATRLAKNWDAALTSAFGPAAATRLRDPVDRWMSAGLQGLAAPDAFRGQVSALSAGALLELGSVAGITPADAGFPSNFQSTWSADSSDILLLGTELSWVPSRLVTALALAPALVEFPQAVGLEGALAESVDCGLVAQTLLAHGAAPGGAVYPSCDESCALSTCSSAVSALWQKARDSSGSTVATLAVTATGRADIGDDASATALQGSWVGELSIGTDTAPASGTLSATSAGN